MPASKFVPAWWLPSPHLQSLWGTFGRRTPPVGYRREFLRAADGDELVLDHLDVVGARGRVILLHGFEGSSHSAHMRCLAREFQQRGASATVINFRHCARDPERPDVTVPNRLFRLYHSGYTADLGHVVNLLRGREPKSRLGAVAISMGGNVLLKWLGENPQEHALDAAATISSPFDLETASRHLESRMGRFYAETYLRTLRPKVEGLARRFPVEATWIDPEKLRRIRGFWGYDHHVTAPLHGFASARDYYTQSSCGPYLRHILVPTLCVNAADDPFMAPETLELARGWASPTMTLLTPARGGHVGFLMGPHPWRVRCWSEEVVVDWVLDHLTANR